MKRRNRTIGVVLLGAVVLALGSMPASAGNVQIIRDSMGVPHVYGVNLKSTWYGVGYAMCQDRLWQAETLRRAATGTSAEYFGPSAVAGDVQARAFFGNKAYRKSLLDQASKGLRKVYKFYAKGVNRCIKDMTAAGALPIEYVALELPPPRRWRVDDSIAVGMLLLNNFGDRGADELDNLADLQALIELHGATTGGAIFLDTHILSDPTAPTSVPLSAASASLSAASGTLTPEALVSSAPDINAKLAARKVRAAFKGLRRNAERAGLSKGPASNAIAIAPELSATGEPLLLGGPQMGYTTPQINHEVGIHGGGYNVTGMAIAGIPAVAIGVTNKHAWTLTTGGTDNNDIYLETLNSSGQYAFGGSFRNLSCRPEVFKIAGAPDVTQVLCETIHGPLVANLGSVGFSFKTSTKGLELESIEGLHGMMRARNIRVFGRQLSRPAYNFNVLYADTKGNIAYWHAGRIPVRAPGDSPWFPHIGAGIAEWQGFIPWNQMPHVKNPSQGWLTSWNNKPQVNWPNSTRGFSQWGPVARVRTLMNLLGALPAGSATVGTVAQINQIAGHTTDTPSGNASTVVVSTLLGDILAQVDTDADPRLPAIVRMLGKWNLLQLDLDVDGRYDSPAVAVFNTWWETFTNRVFADDLGAAFERNVVANLAGRMLKPGLIPLFYNYLGAESVGGAVTASLIETLDALTGTYGSDDMADWLQPAPMITWTPTGAAGVPNTPWMNRGTYNQITRLTKGAIFAQNVIAPGQSGNPFSPHFADQLLNYATWQYKTMNLTKAAALANAESITNLNI